MKRRFLALILIAIVAVATVGGVLFLQAQARTYVPAITIQGSKQAPDFTLVDQYGQPFTLSSLIGKPVLIYFGYTHCPDVCPAVMAKYAEAIQGLGSDANKVVFIIITTDPWRDTPDVLRSWLNRFSTSIVGLTGSADQVSHVWGDYGIPAPELVLQNGTKIANPSESPNYLENHFAWVYVADRNHVMRVALTPEMSDGDYINAVRYVLGLP